MKHCTSFREVAERPTNQVEAGVEVEVEVNVEMNMTCLGTQGEGRTYDARTCGYRAQHGSEMREIK